MGVPQTVSVGQYVSVKGVHAEDPHRLLWSKIGKVISKNTSTGRYRVESETGTEFVFQEGQGQTPFAKKGGPWVRILVDDDVSAGLADVRLKDLGERVSSGVSELQALGALIRQARSGVVSVGEVEALRQHVLKVLAAI